MGIKHFWHWTKFMFKKDIYQLRKNETVDVEIDNFMIDMNGLFHSSAQKIYKYGDYKHKKRLLSENNSHTTTLKTQIQCFEDICNTITQCLRIIKPKKRLILCIDGPAPIAKQNQQRKRRFVSAKNKIDGFDSNCITPGTKFMDYLSKYIDWYIRLQMSNNNPLWKDMEVIFSNEKVPGEGEHKIINYIRNHGDKNESYCIHGMDADLIMLSLGTHIEKFYILREEPRDRSIEFHFIDIGEVYKTLVELLKWEGGKKFDPESAINDFIFMCFAVGNDFLPNIPGVEIIEGSIDSMMAVYKNVGFEYGHLTKKCLDIVKFKKKPVAAFLGTFAQFEHSVLEQKLSHKGSFFKDDILEENAVMNDVGLYIIDIENYKYDYYNKNFDADVDMKKVCHAYLEGMQWVLSYYTRGVPNWKWKFDYHYAPFSSTILDHIKSFKFKVYNTTYPTVPFVQLLSVLPPKSSNLLPSPLNCLLSSESPISKYCPEDFEIDLSGKRKEWEGIVKLPIVDYSILEKEYFKLVKDVDNNDKRRNVLGTSFIYTKSKSNYYFKSFYGDFECCVSTKPIDL